MSSKKLKTEEKIEVIEKFFYKEGLDIDVIYYDCWLNKCILSSTFYLPDSIVGNDLKSLGISPEEYNQYNQDQRIDLSTKIFINHMKAEYEIISAFDQTKTEIGTAYLKRCHTNKVSVDKVYSIIRTKTK